MNRARYEIMSLRKAVQRAERRFYRISSSQPGEYGNRRYLRLAYAALLDARAALAGAVDEMKAGAAPEKISARKF